MSARVKSTVQSTIRIATAAFLVFAVAFDIYAAGSAALLEQRVTEDTIYLFLKHVGEENNAEAQIGTELADGVSFSGASAVPTITWLLVDNSISIGSAERVKTNELLTNLVAGRAENERFNLCTYDEKLNVIAQDSKIYSNLKAQIDAIEYKNQESYLTDVLAELLDMEEQREELAYVRVLVVCDGVDNNPAGLTREELNKRLAENNIPVYTLGCKRSGNDQLLKELYSLSRQTAARSWTLSDLPDTLEVTKAMGGEEIPICAAITIPAKLRDGSVKGVQLTFGDGAVVKTQAMMPFGESLEEPEPTSKPERVMPEPTIVEPESAPAEPVDETGAKDSILAVILIAACTLVVVGTLVFLWIRKKKEKQRIKPVKADPSTVVDQEQTDLLGGAGSGENGRTLILVNDDSRLMLSLTDRANPDRHFQVPLRGRVSIGRSTSNQIVLDYERSISGEHCEIFVDGNTFKIRDLNSSNGTFVDGIRIVDEAEIANGSKIKLGRLEFMVEIR